MANYNEKLNDFGARVKNAELKPSTQHVVQKAKKIVNEVQLNVWLAKELLIGLKQRALDEETSIKEIVNEAIKIHLNQSNKLI